MAKPTHVAVMDFDGTATPKSFVSLFKVIEDNAGFSPEILKRAGEMRNKYLPRAVAGQLTEEEERQWFQETVTLYTDGGLNEKKIRASLAAVKLRPGFVECLRFLKNENVPVAIISYGVEYFIHVVLANNKASELIDAVYSAVIDFDSDGLIKSYKPETVVLPRNKGIMSCRFAYLFDVDFENILAVGDSGGDAHLGYLKKKRLGIAKDEKEKVKLEEFMGTVVITEDFEPVQRWLNSKIRPR